MTTHTELNGMEVPAAPQTDPPPVWSLPPMVEVSITEHQYSVTLHFKSMDRMTDWLKWFRHTTKERKTKRPCYKNGKSIVDKIRMKGKEG